MGRRAGTFKTNLPSTATVSGCARLLHRIRLASTSRRSAIIQLALMCGGLALATWGCGFLDMVFNGENSQTMKEANVCDDLGSEYSSKIPSLVELRTDKAGTTRYRDLRLGGSEIDPQWVPMPNQRTDATGWAQAGNFIKMDFQPPLQHALTPGSVTYVAYAPADARDETEKGQLNTFTLAFAPESGTFHWNGRVYRYSAVHKLPCHPPPQ
jgi:hypothetical protein